MMMTMPMMVTIKNNNRDDGANYDDGDDYDGGHSDDKIHLLME